MLSGRFDLLREEYFVKRIGDPQYLYDEPFRPQFGAVVHYLHPTGTGNFAASRVTDRKFQMFLRRHFSLLEVNDNEFADLSKGRKRNKSADATPIGASP